MVKRKSKKSAKFQDDDICNSLHKVHGDMITKGNKVLDSILDLKNISVSPSLDDALGGGLTEGQVVVMTGDPKTGKSVTCLHIASKAQAMGKRVYYVDTECRLEKKHLQGIKGLNVDDVNVIGPHDEMKSAEQYLNMIADVIKSDEGAVIIIDSISNMLPQEEMIGDLTSRVRAQLPRLLSIFLKRTASDIRQNRIVMICITHNIANTGGSKWSPEKKSDSGNQLQYQASTNMVITHKERWQSAAGEDLGQKVNWLIKTSAAGGIPNTKTESWIRYGIGIDEAKELANVAADLSLIKKSGSWFTLDTFIDDSDNEEIQKVLKEQDVDVSKPEEIEKFFKVQGVDNVSEFLSRYPTLCKILQDKLQLI